MIKLNHLMRAGLGGWAVISGLLFSSSALANVSYMDILKSLTPGKANIVTAIPELAALQQASSIAQAQQLLADKSILRDSPAAAEVAAVSEAQVQDLMKRRSLTFVVVPGVLGEFIDIRAFEEIFARDSSYKREWPRLAALGNNRDERFNLQAYANVTMQLSDLIDAASVDDASGRPLFKIIILKTPLGSLESVGKNDEKAQIFNRRLQKYQEATGDQNLVLLGYSRGTPLALEMIVQAEKQKLGYLKNVKAVVSYAGVVMGSSLADVTDDLSNANGILLEAAKKLRDGLQYSESILDRPAKLRVNGEVLAQFLRTLAANSDTDPEALLTNARSGDFRTAAALIAKMAAELGLKALLDFNGHVTRLKMFVSEVLFAVEGLKSKNMEAWWRANTLPKNIPYYSLTAAMVDPDKGGLEAEIYRSHEGYSDSLDDTSLLGNKRTYEEVTGVGLNDSQVAVHQSLFLPGVIAGLNPANRGLRIEALGLLQTHHWGVALQSVNKMRDGRLNPFPREKVLWALAAYLNQ